MIKNITFKVNKVKMPLMQYQVLESVLIEIFNKMSINNF